MGFGLLNVNMISKMKKRIILLVISIIISLDVYSICYNGNGIQNCKETDSINKQKCIQLVSVFTEYYKQKDFVTAYKSWSWVFKNCPKNSINTYKYAPRILNAKIKEDKENKSFYVDTLLMVFDQRIECFGQRGYVLGLKGYELLRFDKSKAQEAYTYLEESIELDRNSSSVQAVEGYMKSLVILEKSALKTKLDVIEGYAKVSEIIDYNINNQTKTAKNFIKKSAKIEDLFTPYANCDDLEQLFSSKFDKTTNDLTLLKKISKLLKSKKCMDSDLFFNVSSRLYELDPSASSANLMANMCIAKRNFSLAIKYSNEAISLEEDASKKADYYLTLADAYRYSGSYSSARNSIYNALKIRSGWGKAYVSLGNTYIAGLNQCGEEEFSKKAVYWIAVDAFQKALSDPEFKKIAAKQISIYSRYFPSIEECFFNGLTPNDEYNVGCWINKKTIIRTSD
tara:strand:- start:19302 stop:20663 length:1362 start_codon:yes stop_codon:yes gene_type:complete